jgi:Putative prokaryotic signal transducing protein
MEEIDELVPEVRLCEVSNEPEAAMVVALLQAQDIPARSDASPGMDLFGGLPFEPGHHIFVPRSMAKKAREILSHYPHFKDLKNVHEPEP